MEIATLKSGRPLKCFMSAAILLCTAALLTANHNLFAQEGEDGDGKKNGNVERIKGMLDGFTIGKDTHVLPYASIEDWFDPYGGMKLEHRSLWKPEDRVSHNIKFETPRDYSWKFRYLANSLSGATTKLSFIFKLKFDRDAFFYGIGNSTLKSTRAPATYSSVFFGTEIKHVISTSIDFSWSPGFWSFQSGLLDGREFEPAADAKLITSRFALRDPNPIDYAARSVVNQWSTYVEVGLPTNEPVSTYVRFNVETLTRFPLSGDLKFVLGTRVEYLVSTDRILVPYFALPETGSRSGLRGFSKERFRNYGLHVINFELAHPIFGEFEAFLLSDLAQTGSNPINLLGNKAHPTIGIGLRFIHHNSPISAGVATGRDGWKLFSSISAALSF